MLVGDNQNNKRGGFHVPGTYVPGAFLWLYRWFTAQDSPAKGRAGAEPGLCSGCRALHPGASLRLPGSRGTLSYFDKDTTRAIKGPINASWILLP